MRLTTEERAELTAQLADAKRAYHELLTGQQARVYVDQSGERVEYLAANREALRGYIMQLEVQLGKKPASSAPLGFWMK